MVLLFIFKSFVLLTYKILKMNNFLYTVSFLLIFVSCKKDKPLVPLTVEKESKTINDACKQDECAEITLNYLIASGNEEASEKVNRVIEDFIIQSLNISEDSLYVPKSIEEATSNFIKIYKRDKSEYPDMGVYFAEVSVNEMYSSPSILSLEKNAYLYTGGAHGYGATSYSNFDAQTGEPLKMDELIKDKNGFLALAEEKFRTENEIPEGEPINATGFWFENDTFYLPESFGISPEELIFVYNQYEIASYAAGPIEFRIPIKEAEPFLRLNLK